MFLFNYVDLNRISGVKNFLYVLKDHPIFILWFYGILLYNYKNIYVYIYKMWNVTGSDFEIENNEYKDKSERSTDDLQLTIL